MVESVGWFLDVFVPSLWLTDVKEVWMEPTSLLVASKYSLTHSLTTY